MPKPRIWDVEGRVQGSDLGNGKFQFDFTNEEDLLKVLSRRPCHFNRWSFSLERWEANIREDFPNTMLFWVHVTGIPPIYKKDQTYRGIGEALGEAKTVDVDGARVQVSLNGDNPLQFERKVGFDNGDIVKVSLRYEGLHRYCFSCKRISHKERTCPELSDLDRMRNKQLRADSSPSKIGWHHSKAVYRKDEDRAESSSLTRRNLERDYDSRRPSQRDDLRKDIQEKREYQSKGVWDRLEHNRDREYPRYRERYHPYGDSRKGHSHDRRAAPYAPRSRIPSTYGESDDLSYGTDRRVAKGGNKDSLEATDSQRTISDLQQTEYKLARLHIDQHSRSLGKVHPGAGNLYGRRESNRADKGKEITAPAPIWREKVSTNQKGRDKSIMEQQLLLPPPPAPNPSDIILAHSNGTIPGEITGPCTVSDFVTERKVAEEETKETPSGEVDTNEVDRMEFEKEMGLELMDDETLENDDLLDEEEMPVDEFLVEDEMVEEGQERIEAITQLHTPRETKELVQTASFMEKEARYHKNKKVQNSSQNNPDVRAGNSKVTDAKLGKRRTPKSPDIKGVASKKINALRIRQSPKKKTYNSRPKTNGVPRNEVFPSALGKKSAANLGSVVSQKPPSTHI